MTRAALVLALALSTLAVSADDAGAPASAMYTVRVVVKDLVTADDGGEKAAVVAAPTLAVPESRETVCQIGDQITVGDENINSGTLLKVRLKKSDAGQVRVSGMLELSSMVARSDDFVERQAISYHFSRTVKLGEKVSLGKRETDDGWRTVELIIQQVGVASPVTE